jgi:anhydro-N-acetylmuramic acid kinase
VAADISHSDGAYAVKQRAFNTFPWLDNERQLIFRLFKERNLSSADLCEANFLLGKAFSRAVHQLLESSAIDRKEVDLIGSHGQTIWHNVDESGKVTSTLQIGEAAVIAEETGITTVADFRFVLRGGKITQTDLGADCLNCSCAQ